MRKTNWFFVIPLLIFFLVISYYIFTTSTLVRFWADDFCSSVLLRNNGYFNSQIIWWNGWTGRYSYIAFLDFVELFGLTGAKTLPLILFFSTLITNLPLVFISLISLVNSPNIIQTFYWMTGSLNYFIPFVFLNFFLLILFKQYNKYLLTIAFVLLFIATGFSEAFGIANALFLSFLYLIIEKKETRKLLVVGLIATALSLGLMALAPGNVVRSATVTHPSGILDLITKTFVYSKWYLVHLFYIKTFVISILTIIAVAFVFLKSSVKYFAKPKLVAVTSVLFIIGITIAVVGLTYQAMNWEPPERVMSIVNNMIIFAIIIFAIALFQLTNKFVPKLIPKVLFLIFILMLTYQVNYDWGRVKQELKKSAESSTYIAVGKLDGLEENNGWVKSCIISYYK